MRAVLCKAYADESGYQTVACRSYAEQIELIATYSPNPKQYPDLKTSFIQKAF